MAAGKLLIFKSIVIGYKLLIIVYRLEQTIQQAMRKDAQQRNTCNWTLTGIGYICIYRDSI